MTTNEIPASEIAVGMRIRFRLDDGSPYACTVASILADAAGRLMITESAEYSPHSFMFSPTEMVKVDE